MAAQRQLYSAWFERSDDGSTWSMLGTATRIASGWSLGGLNLPRNQSVWLRARGVAHGGYMTGSVSLVESVRRVYLARFSVTASVQAGQGSVMPPTQDVDRGQDMQFTVTPAVGWHVAAVSGDTCTPTDQGNGTWRAPNIQAACAVGVTFEQNVPPSATPQSLSAPFNTALPISLAGADPNPGGPLTFTYAIVAQPSHGTITGLEAGTGALTYTPTPGYLGSDSFTFTVSTVNRASPPAMVSLDVTSPQLALSVHDGRDFVRYGQVVDYVVTLTNTGGPATAVPVAFTLSAGFDGDHAHLACSGAGGGATCAQDGSDPLRFTVTLPATRSLTWLVSVPVRSDATEAGVDLGVAATGAAPVFDTNTLVVFRDGFDVPNGDGAQSVPVAEGAPAKAILEGDALRTIEVPAMPAAATPLLRPDRPAAAASVAATRRSRRRRRARAANWSAPR